MKRIAVAILILSGSVSPRAFDLSYPYGINRNQMPEDTT